MKTKTQPTNAGYVVIYNQIKKTRKEYLKKNNIICKEPWYKLTKSEIKEVNKNKIAKPMGKAKFMESIVQHKLSKWIKKNPAPNDKQNLFYKEFTEDWEKKKEKKLQYYRDIVVLTYYKLKIYGFYSYEIEDGNYRYETKLLKVIKDKYFESIGVKTNCLNKNTKLNKILYYITLEKGLENKNLRRVWIETTNKVHLDYECPFVIMNDYYLSRLYHDYCDDKKNEYSYNKNVNGFWPIIKNHENKLYTCKLHDSDTNDIIRKIKGSHISKDEMNKLANEIINKTNLKYNCVGVIYGGEHFKEFEKKIAA